MESKKISVRCECNDTAQIIHAPSFEETLAIVGAASLRAYGKNPFLTRSFFASKDCTACNATGYILVPNGPDDVDKEPCQNCGGTGRVLANN